jgi:hypothetical protein
MGVVRGRAFCSSDGFEIFGDGGTGKMDWDHPVTARRVLLWPETCPMAGHLLDGHVAARHMDAFQPDGHLEGTHLLDAYLYPAATIDDEVGPCVLGRFRFAIVMQDVAGNRETDGVTINEVVVNSEPEPARRLRPTARDAGSDRMTFAFEPSNRLVG